LPGNIKVRVGTDGIKEASKERNVVVVVDVLRASSTMITAINNGALSIIPASTISRAKELAKTTPNSILCGERRGLRISGFQLGNSPSEYTSQRVRDMNIVLTTSNCTRILERCKQLPSCEDTLIGAFLNATAVAKKAKRLAVDEGTDISIIQVGEGEKPSRDDSACAQLIKRKIESKARANSKVVERIMTDSLIYSLLSKTRHGRYLIRMGFNDDIRYCSQLDTTIVVPKIYRTIGGNEIEVRAYNDHRRRKI